MIFPSLQTQIEADLGIENDKYNQLMASYSFPNMVAPFLAGILIDRLGMRVGIIGYTTLMVIGMLI